MKYSKLTYYVSDARLNRFLRACGNSKTKAQKLYVINLRVAQAFYPLLNLFETFLRNSLNQHVGNHFANPNWLRNQKMGFMNNATLAPSFYLKKGVQAAENKCISRGWPLSPGKIVSEQVFGFWTAFFDTRNYALMGGSPMNAFPNKPQHINRQMLRDKLNKVREFRNRVYHNEPICFSGNAIDFTLARLIMVELHELLQWIDPELLNYANYFNNIDKKIDLANGM